MYNEINNKMKTYKDLSEGHYENDGCGIFEHNTEEKSKVNIRQSGNSNGYLIEITNTPIDQIYAVTKDELEQIVLLGQIILKDLTPQTRS